MSYIMLLCATGTKVVFLCELSSGAWVIDTYLVFLSTSKPVYGALFEPGNFHTRREVRCLDAIHSESVVYSVGVHSF